ncbi:MULTISPECIES: hypothetical protein [Elizabethkingia]|uniref:hypothetical protein n=1 Tax=Elizabethkingia TaxID=308865 RepID=UPI0010C18323|nr:MULTISPECIES: hypothetical protein [Elizabethkingia]QCO45763.1 hypothetical protein FCS00_05035 [Elizabethkingia sp. 2-6]WQM37684.1 hypothetical protein U2S95_15095 [Elizabethkingia miricola]
MKQFKNVEIIRNENEATKPSSQYIVPFDNDSCEVFITDDNGVKRKVKSKESNNYTVKLSKEFALLPAKNTGEITGEIPSTKATVYLGSNIDNGWTYNASFINCVGSIDSNTGDIDVNSLNQDAARVDITANKDGNSPLNSTYVLSKVKAGIDGMNGTNGNPSFKSIAFIRSTIIPSTPTGGNWNTPIPSTSGWSDGIPSGTNPIYMSTRIFTLNGQSPQQQFWTTPRLASDTPDIDFEFSSVVNNPGSPTLNPENWYNEGREDSIWMAIRKLSNGNWGEWNINKIKGEKGDPGPVSDLYLASRGNWTSTAQYIGTSKRVEAVKYSGVWYVSKETSGNIPIGTLPTNEQYWKLADRTYDFVATGLFLAETAYIENLGVRNLRTNDSGTRLEINESDNSLSFYSGDLVSPAIRLTSLNSGSTEYVNGAFINVTGRTSSNTIISSAGIGTNGILSSAFDIGFATKYLGGDIGSVQTGNAAISGYYNKSGGNPGGFRDKFVGIAGENIEGKTDLDSKMYGGYIDKLLVTSIYHSGINVTSSGTVTIQPNTGLITHSNANTTLVLPSLTESIYSMEITLLKLDGNTVTLNSTKNITFDSSTSTSINLTIRGRYSIYFINNSWQVFKSAS